MTVRGRVHPNLEPPSQLALIKLDEDVRLLSHVPDPRARIGERLRLDWRERPDGPPLPEFRRVPAAASALWGWTARIIRDHM